MVMISQSARASMAQQGVNDGDAGGCSALFYGNGTDRPWGNRGVELAAGVTVREALAMDPIQFEERDLRPVQTLGSDFRPIDVPGARAVVGMLSGTPYGLVGDSYRVHQPELCAEVFETVAGEAGARIDVLGTLRGGRLMWAQAHVPGLSFDVGTRDRPDVVEGRLTFMTSFDGSMATIMGDVATRIVCRNTFAHASGEKRDGKRIVSIKHTSQSEDRVRSYAKELEGLRAGFMVFAELADKLASRPFSASDFAELAAALVPDPTDARPTKAQNKRAELAALFANGQGQDLPGAKGTAWGALNAVTEWTTWKAPLRNGDQSDRWLSSVNGDGAELASQAAIVLAAYV